MPEKKSTKVSVACPNTVKARSACFVRSIIPAGLDHAKEGLIGPMQSLYDSRGLIVSCSMVCKKSNCCPVYMVNPAYKDVELSKGTPLATFSLTDTPHSPGTDAFIATYNIWHCSRELLMCASMDPNNEDCLSYRDPYMTELIHVTGCKKLPPDLAQMFRDHKLINSELNHATDLILDSTDIFLGPGEKLGRTDVCDGHEMIQALKSLSSSASGRCHQKGNS